MFGWFKRRKREDNWKRLATTGEYDHNLLADPPNTGFDTGAGSDSSGQDSSPCDSGGFDGGGADCGETGAAEEASKAEA